MIWDKYGPSMRVIQWNPNITICQGGVNLYRYIEESLYRGSVPCILLLPGHNIFIVISGISLYRRSLYRGSTVYGIVYGPYMVFIWVRNGTLASISNPYLVTVFSQLSFYCLLLWDCYVFCKVPYIFHIICMGTVWDRPLAIPYDPESCLWDFYVFRKVP